jgi:ComF family protein
LQELANSLFSVVFPASCLLCGQELIEAGGLNVCPACWGSLEPWTGAACAQCGLPLASGEAIEATDPKCAPCLREEYEFDRARSFGPYARGLRAVILQLKFRERLGKRLGELLVPVWRSVNELRESETPVVVPVPLHRSRERQRGFNQAELLARALTRRLGRERGGQGPQVEARCLVRTRPTLPQTGLSPSARRENVRAVFAVSSPERIGGRTAVLVDDVMTTGATLSACAAALKRAGAGRVIALTLARATPQFPDTASATDAS